MVAKMHLHGLQAARSDVIYVTRLCNIMMCEVSSSIHKARQICPNWRRNNAENQTEESLVISVSPAPINMVYK